MSEKKTNPELPKSDAAEVKKPESKPEPMKTIWTHGKKFRVPANEKLENFLRQKYPEEYKK